MNYKLLLKIAFLTVIRREELQETGEVKHNFFYFIRLTTFANRNNRLNGREDLERDQTRLF
jgi:hypothetical protein